MSPGVTLSGGTPPPSLPLVSSPPFLPLSVELLGHFHHQTPNNFTLNGRIGGGGTAGRSGDGEDGLAEQGLSAMPTVSNNP